jgi:hypothetical protein
MYKNQLVLAVKHAGKILREFGDEVRVPFGSEYSLLIKNLNTVRASVSVLIDGEDVLDGRQLAINPGEDVELERFIRNGNLAKGNRFKFIERTAAVEKHRGIRAADGLVQITFQFERQACKPLAPLMPVWPQAGGIRPFDDWYGRPVGGGGSMPREGCGVLRSAGSQQEVVGPVSFSAQAAAQNAAPGITVPGAASEQKFQNAGPMLLEPGTHSLVLKLTGEVLTQEDGGVLEVSKPVTTKEKPKCITCGKKNPPKAKFCSECGTGLVLY